MHAPAAAADPAARPCHDHERSLHVPCRQQRKSFPLVDATEPNLLEDTFDYSLPPLIRFDGPVVEYIDGQPVEFDPQALKTRDIFITDTTFRDGQQARPPYTIDQMVHIYDLLAQAERPQRRHPPDRVLPLHEERPRDARPLPRAGPPLSRMHRLDPRRARATSAWSRRPG